MGAKLFQKAVSKFAVVAILNAFQVQPSKAFEIRIPNPLALGAEALGIKLYKFSPAYRQFLSPYIQNQDTYDKLIKDYGGKKQFSGKSGISLILRLGILRNQPKWLTLEALREIQKYYPIAEKKTERLNSYLKLAYGMDFQSYTISDASPENLYLQYALAGPDAATGVAVGATAAELVPALQAATRAVLPALRLPPVAATAALVVAAATVFELNRNYLFKYLTPEAQALIVAAENTVCQNIEGGCTRTSQSNSRGRGGDDCDIMHERDLQVCRTIGYRNKTAASRCYKSAYVRRDVCERGGVVPPLDTGN